MNRLEDLGQDALLKHLSSEINKKQEAMLLSQINDMIKRGVVIVSMTEPVITIGPPDHLTRGPDGVHFSQAVKLTFRGEERVAELEAEVAALKAKIEGVMGVLLS